MYFSFLFQPRVCYPWFPNCGWNFPTKQRLPCVAKPLQTDTNYFRIIYALSVTAFNCLEFTTGLQIQIWPYYMNLYLYLVVGCRLTFRNWKKEVIQSLTPKAVRRGCKRSFEPWERKTCTWCKRLLGDVCAVGPKQLLHPLLSTFGGFLFSTPLPGALVCNTCACSHSWHFQKKGKRSK